jgi:hypothetical protein
MNAEALKFLASCPGPCITAIVPDHHPGAPAGSRRLIIQNLVKAATERLAGSPFKARAADLLAPLKDLTHDAEVTAGGPGFAIFCSPDTAAWYRAPGHAEKLVVANHPYLTPFLADAAIPAEVFVLGLGTKHLRLFRYSHGNCVEMNLPKGVPASLEEAGREPAPNIENRSSIGSSTGTMHAMRFGTGSDRERAGEHLLHFFGLVDRGLEATLAGRPLLLMGVHEAIQAYRRAAKYGHLLEAGVDGGTEFLAAAEVAVYAREAGRADYERRADAVLTECRETKERFRRLRDVRDILRAAALGRIHRLCVRKDTRFLEAQEEDFAHEDLLNAAAAETLRTNGEVFEVGPDRMAEAEPAAAILRY